MNIHTVYVITVKAWMHLAIQFQSAKYVYSRSEFRAQPQDHI